MKPEIKYNKEVDILTINTAEAEYEQTVQHEDALIDIDIHGNFRSLELLNASKHICSEKTNPTSLDKEEVSKVFKKYIYILCALKNDPDNDKFIDATLEFEKELGLKIK